MALSLKYLYNTYYSKVLSLLIILLFMDVIVDSSNKIFHIKYILFAGTILFWLPKALNKKFHLPRGLVYIVLFISFFMPVYALSLGAINAFLKNSDIGLIIYFNSFFFFLLTLVIVHEKIDLTQIFNYSSLLVVVITLLSYVILAFNPTLFGDLYQFFVVKKELAMYALRNFGDFTMLMLFYKTSPLLVFPLSYYLYQILIVRLKKGLFLKIVILILVATTLFLSGTRANILSLFLIALFYLAFYVYKRSKPLFVLVITAYTLIVFIGLSGIWNLLFNIREASNMIKFGHLISYFEHFSDNIGILIFGQGLGGSFYSYGVNRLAVISELSYFEIIRVWGLPIAVLFISVLFLPIYYELKSRKISHLFIAYLAYLFIAGTNQYLLTSTGMIVLVYVFSNMFISLGVLNNDSQLDKNTDVILENNKL